MKNSFLFLLFTVSSFALVSDIYKEVEKRTHTVVFDKKTETAHYAFSNAIYTEDFEGTHGWSFVNGTQTNQWFVGTAVSNGGTRSLYISDNSGIANHYDITASSVTHAYKDIMIPANTTEVDLSFDWRSVGMDDSDVFRVWIVPTSFLPGPGAQIFPGADRIQVGNTYSEQATWLQNSTVVDVSAYAGQSLRLVFQWNNGGWTGTQTPAAIDNIVLAKHTCSFPSNIQINDINATTVNLSWTASATANISSYDYYISTTNSITTATVPTGNVTTASADLENLMPGTQYYFWVRSNCGTTDGYSLWTGPFPFFSQCTAINLPYTETFNSDSSTVSCWSVINGNNDNIQWDTSAEWNSFEGDQAAQIAIEPWNPVVNDDYLISPVFNFNGQYRLKYYYSVSAGQAPQTFSVKMSQNGGNEVSDFTQIIVAEQEYVNESYIEKIVYLPAFTGQGAFAWYVGNSNNRQVFIDKVVIEPVPLCPEPYELTRTQLTDELVSLVWQQYGTVSSWEVIIIPHGQDIPDDLTTVTVYQTNTAAITIDGLEDITAYDIYVRAVCNATDKSDWSSVLEIKTLPSNDDCEDATVVPVNPGIDCIESVTGSVVGATPSETGQACFENPYNDVWYEFIAQSAKHSIQMEVSNFATPYVAVYEMGICNEEVLMPFACMITDGTQLMNLEGLTVGNTYKIRIYTSEWEPDVTFNICLLTPDKPILVNDTQYTIPQLVTDVLIDNPCAAITNITWSTGTNFNDVNGIGYFEKNNSGFSFEDGIILSTGAIHLAPGPAGGNINSGQMSDWPHDIQLTDYMNIYLNQPAQEYHNASVLEFDFVALSDQFKFNFIFASNEYGYYQCDFSDAFAFFLTNTTTGITTNLAIVPNTTDPVSVTTIRKGIHSPVNGLTGLPMCGDANPEYFDVCYNPAYNGENPLTSPVNFYGLTVPMVAQSAVVPGTTYHIKLAIQDWGDSGRDSSVFIEGGSFDLGDVELGEDLLVESGNALCSGDSYVIDSELNSGDYTIQWYKDNVLIAGATGTTLAVTESGEYRIEALIANTTCALTDTIKVEMYPEIKVVPPKNIEICVFNQSIPTADLTISEDEMLSLLSDLADIEVGYYETEAAAELEAEAITDPENYLTSQLPKEIFIRIENTKTGCHRIVSFNLVVKKVVDLKKPENIVVCEYDGVQVSADLTTVKADIVSQLTNPDVTLHYYQTYENAIDEVGAIAAPQNYEPVTLPATVYIRFTDTATGCELMTSVDIVASPKLTPIEVEDIIICNKYVVPELPQGYFYSTEAYGQGQIIKKDKEYNPGSYKLYINIQNADGCVFSSSYTIEVVDCSIPKGISPNGDQLNDSFDLAYYHVLEVVIYNRDGREVYVHGPGYTNQWYGQNKQGKPLPDGTYFYKITTATELFTGYVQLVREIK